MNRYILTGDHSEGEVEYGFNTEGFLTSYEVRIVDVDQKQIEFLLKFLPMHEKDISKLEPLKNINIKLIPPDLGFDHFWETYDYKVGNRKRAKKLWDELRKGDKIAVYRHLPKYKYYLQIKPNLDKVYPETFLYQKRYENVLPISKK